VRAFSAPWHDSRRARGLPTTITETVKDESGALLAATHHRFRDEAQAEAWLASQTTTQDGGS